MSYYPEDAPAFEMSEDVQYNPPRPLPDDVLIRMQEAVDWIQRARPGDVFQVEKLSHRSYVVKRMRRAA